MSRRQESDLSTGLLLQLLALSTPIVVTAVSQDTIDTVLSGLGLAALLAVFFVVFLVAGFQYVELDRIDFLIASIFGPVIVFLSIVVVKSVLWQLLNFVEGWPENHRNLWAATWNVFEFIAPDFGALFVYVSLFGVAGFVAVGIDRRLHFDGQSSISCGAGE